MDRLMQIGLQLDETNYILFLVDTTHAQGNLTLTQQVMQMLLVQANSYNFRASVQKYYGETGKVGRSVHYTAILVFFQ